MGEFQHALIEGWRECTLEKAPFLFPGDKTVFDISNVGVSVFGSHDEFIQSSRFGLRYDRSLHIGLVPIPYIGNLQRARIFILMLNPGLSSGDYYAEETSQEYRDAHIRNLRQENHEDEFPFLFLNPLFAWHPGFEYWHKKLRDIAEALTLMNSSHLVSLRTLSQNIACLQLVPYHSKSFGAHSLIGRLESSQLMLDYVHETLVGKAADNEIILIVTRQTKSWGFLKPENENIVIYSATECRAAHLGRVSRGGKRIAEMLGI